LLNSNPALTVHLAGNSVSAQGLARLDDWAHNNIHQRQPLPPAPTQPRQAPEQTEPPVKDSSEELLQAKIQNSLLKKDIEALRHTNMALQTTFQSQETQLSNCALRITELEQNLLRETAKNSQLHESLADCREKLAKMTDDQGRLVSAWEVERAEWTAAKKGNVNWKL
jgi:predicted RNase H-like nuclease (RuvC/YqgF family)